MIIKENVCPCAYCDYFKPIECLENDIIVQKGVCIKKGEIRELYDYICEKFILNKAVHTNKWYPKK